MHACRSTLEDPTWEFRPENGFDQESLDLYRIYTRLHLRLWPYLWTYAERVLVDGRPLQRPYGLMWPELGRHPSDTYALGDHLLVAPVLEQGARERMVPFPPGRWADWWTGEILEGGADRVVPAPLDKLPLYLAEGGVVPLLRPTIDTLSPTTSPDVDSYATTPGVLYVRVFPGPLPTLFDLFDGTLIALDGDTIDTQDGAELAQGMVLEIVGDAPISATLDDAPHPFERTGALTVVSIPPGAHRLHLER